MRAASDDSMTTGPAPRTRTWIARLLVLAATTPGSPSVFGYEPPVKEAVKEAVKGEVETIAKKVDDSTRLGGDSSGKHALAPVLEAARASRETARKTAGYSATFMKNELTPKKGMVRHTMAIKFRREPFSVYLKFVEPYAGREVLYVEGKNNGKLLVHEASGIVSLAGTLSINPTGDEAMKESRYPIMNFGMEKLLDVLIAQWEGELKHGESEVTAYPHAKVGDVECRMFEVTHPKERPHFKFKTTRIYIDRQSNLPIRVEQYAFPSRGKDEPPLVEEYTYSNVKVEMKLADRDFDVKNERYGFK